MRVLNLFGIVLLIALTVLSHLDTLSFEFINWGDDVKVYDNVRAYELTPHAVFWFFTHAYAGAYAPLAFLSHASDIARWGLNSWGHHFTNLVLHVSNAVLVFLICMHLMQALYRSSGVKAISASFFAAALFATHPLAIAAVAWIAARGILLCEFFMLLACFFSLQSGTAQCRTGRFAYAAIACFTLAGLSDFGGLLLPLVLVVLCRFAGEKSGQRVEKSITHKLLLFGVCLLFLAAGIITSTSQNNEEMWDVDGPLRRFAFPFVQLFRPILLFMNPSSASPITPFPSDVDIGIGLFGFSALTMVVLLLAKRGVLAPAMVWIAYIALALPRSFTLPPGDHYAYLPLPLMTISLTSIGLSLHDRYIRQHTRFAFLIAALSLVFAISFITVRQQTVWRDAASLWRHVIALYPKMATAYNFLGLALQTSGRMMEAKEAYTHAIGLKPDLVEAYLNLGNIHVAEGDWQEADRLYYRAAELAPQRADVYNNLGIAAKAQGKSLDALYWLRKAIEIDSSYAQGYVNLAALYEQMGNTAAAYDALLRAARLGDVRAQERLKHDGVKW